MPDVFSTVNDVDSSVVLDYTSRDFTAIRSQLVGLARGILPEWETVGEASDFGTLILELFAYMGDVLHFYIDRTASEAFLGTAIRRQSVLYIADMLGYTPIGQQSAIVTLYFSLDANAPESITLPSGTRVHNEASDANDLIVFETNFDVTLAPGDADIPVPATEGVMTYDYRIGISQGTPNTEFIIPDKGVVYGTVTLKSREGPSIIDWTYISDLSLARPTQTVFTTFIDDNEYTHILFGDQAAGRVPPVNAEIFITYRTGVGVEANSLAVGDLSVLVPPADLENVWGVSVTNNDSPVGGTDPESIDAMRNSIPRAAARLKNRAITLNDYADLALQVPGVAKSVAHGEVYTVVHVTIAPIQGKATDDYMDLLCQQVERYMQDKIIVGSTVSVDPRSPNALNKLWADVFIQVMVHVQDSYNRNTVRTTVEHAIRQMIDFDNVDFGTRISIGSIYRMALAVQGVEWVDLIWLDGDASASSHVGMAPADNVVRNVTNKAATTTVATLTIGTHPFIIGDQVTVAMSPADATLDGVQTITAIAATTISYARAGTAITSAAATGTVTEKNPQKVTIWADDDRRVIGDVQPGDLFIPKIEGTEVIEDPTDWPIATYPDLESEESRTHDGLWVRAVGGLLGT